MTTKVYARVYAQIIGVVLILVGLVGLVLGDQVWLGILNVDILEDVVHLITGSLLAYVGFGRVDQALTRTVVGVLGVIYLVVGVLGFVVPMIFGLIPPRLHPLRQPAAPSVGDCEHRTGLVYWGRKGRAT